MPLVTALRERVSRPRIRIKLGNLSELLAPRAANDDGAKHTPNDDIAKLIGRLKLDGELWEARVITDDDLDTEVRLIVSALQGKPQVHPKPKRVTAPMAPLLSAATSPTATDSKE